VLGLALWHRVGDPVGAARTELALARLSPEIDDQLLAEGATRRLATLGIRLPAAAAAAGLMAHVPVAEAAPIEIRTLGGFSVLREGEAIASGEWQSRKARDLVKILVARRGRSTPREMLMEALWPDEDPARLSNRLSVALSTARAVFDPDKRHPADHYIAADGESARLVMPSLTLDVDRFLRRAAVGLRLLGQGQDADALPHLGAAEAEYSGDFLEEDAYVDWATPLREEARAAYLAVTRALAETAGGTGDLDSAVRYHLRILERDPYDEDAHLRLVGTLAKAGRHGEARRHYRAYGGLMREIDVEAAPYPSAARA